jgi:hypothetical protein
MGSEDDTLRALMLQFLEWVAQKPRRYDEVMSAWRTSCPRMPVWEEAVSQGLVRRQANQSLRNAIVIITDTGRQVLQAAQNPATPAGVEGPRPTPTSSARTSAARLRSRPHH